MYWFTSDTHFGHANIIRYDRRPFGCIEEHDRELITRWNAAVDRRDVVYHLGDFAWHNNTTRVDEILTQLHGTKILIYGNHDSKAVKRSTQWAKVTPYDEVTIEKQKICLFHYRMVVWNRSRHGSWALHGHSHGRLPVLYNILTLDVGTMLWNYTPVSFSTLKIEMTQRELSRLDERETNP